METNHRTVIVVGSVVAVAVAVADVGSAAEIVVRSVAQTAARSVAQIVAETARPSRGSAVPQKPRRPGHQDLPPDMSRYFCPANRFRSISAGRGRRFRSRSRSRQVKKFRPMHRPYLLPRSQPHFPKTSRSLLARAARSRCTSSTKTFSRWQKNQWMRLRPRQTGIASSVVRKSRVQPLQPGVLKQHPLWLIQS